MMQTALRVMRKAKSNVKVAIDRPAHNKDKMILEVEEKGRKETNLKIKRIKRKRKNLRGLRSVVLEEMVSVPQLQEAVDQISHRKRF